jgi:phage repressor protein C with HTH and peptisase S24 domain
MVESSSEKLFGERIKEMIRVVGSAQKLANMTGMSARVIGQYAAGSSDPTRSKMVALAEAAGFNVCWVATGEGPKMMSDAEEPTSSLTPPSASAQARYVSVPSFSVHSSPGGHTPDKNDEQIDFLQFKPEWIAKTLGTSADHLTLAGVKGDSMEPTLSDGDIILVDTTDGRFKANAIYALQIWGSLQVRRIQRKTDGTVVLRSDNKSYEPETVLSDRVQYLEVVGRVVWHGRRMK